jgi:hypothetical protein
VLAASGVLFACIRQTEGSGTGPGSAGAPPAAGVASSVELDASEAVLPVTDRMLVVSVRDGHIVYYGQGQKFEDNVVYRAPLDTRAAADPKTFTLFSRDDAAYAAGVHPVAVGRKTKGTDFHLPHGPELSRMVLGHHLYLELPRPLVPGSTYTLALPGILPGRSSVTFRFDVDALRSPTIHVNQIGYRPEARKVAYLSQWMGDFDQGPHRAGALSLDDRAGARFHMVRTTDRARVFSGDIAKRHDRMRPEVDNADFRTGGWAGSIARTDVWEADFSAFAQPGEYVVSVEGIGCSYPFVIERDAYRPAWHALMRGLFFQRASVDKELEPNKVYPRDHHFEQGKGPKIRGKLVRYWGFYHDAGDWDGYPRHVAVPKALLALYDLKPASFRDGDVGNRWRESDRTGYVDEGKNGIPDLLDEALWLVSALRRSRSALREAGVGTGGVTGGGVGPDATDLSTPSWLDQREFTMDGEDTDATFHYVGLAAEAARALSIAGRPRAEVDDWRKEALSAWVWAAARKDAAGAANGQVYAAAALYRLTGDARYQDALRAAWEKTDSNGDYWMYPTPRQFAAYVYARVPEDHPNLDSAFHKSVRSWLVASADRHWVEPGAERAFRLPFDRHRFHAMGLWSTPRVMTLAFAHALTGAAKYRDAIHAFGDYMLGGNELDLVWISGLGHNYVRNVFHVDSWSLFHTNSPAYDNEVMPGLVPYATHRTPDTMGPPGNRAGWEWTGDEDFSRSSAYPPIDRFPASETRFDNRYSIMGGEFTIEDNLAQAIFGIGWLLADSDGTFRANERPSVELVLEEDTLGPEALFSVKASSDVSKVEYFVDWRSVGASRHRERGFAWRADLRPLKLEPGTTVTVSAVAYDHRGLRSQWTKAVERSVKVRPRELGR